MSHWHISKVDWNKEPDYERLAQAMLDLLLELETPDGLPETERANPSPRTHPASHGEEPEAA